MEYPNKRDCEHGQQRRACNICELEAEIKTLKSHFIKLRSEAAKIINSQITIEGCNHRFTRQVYDHCERVLSD